MYDELVERLVGAAAVVPVGPAHGPAHGLRPAHRRRRARARSRGTSRWRTRRATSSLAARRRARRRLVRRARCVIVTDRRPVTRWRPTRSSGRCSRCCAPGDFDHAIALANDTDYALTAGVFSALAATHRRMRRGTLRAGNVYVNRGITGAVVGRQPFGGFGAVRRRLQGGRPRLPAAVRRAPRRHREHPPPGLRTAARRRRGDASGVTATSVLDRRVGPRNGQGAGRSVASVGSRCRRGARTTELRVRSTRSSSRICSSTSSSSATVPVRRCTSASGSPLTM